MNVWSGGKLSSSKTNTWKFEMNPRMCWSLVKYFSFSRFPTLEMYALMPSASLMQGSPKSWASWSGMSWSLSRALSKLRHFNSSVTPWLRTYWDKIWNKDNEKFEFNKLLVKTQVFRPLQHLFGSNQLNLLKWYKSTKRRWIKICSLYKSIVRSLHFHFFKRTEDDTKMNGDVWKRPIEIVPLCTCLVILQHFYISCMNNCI